jgi:hypothetical protein
VVSVHTLTTIHFITFVSLYYILALRNGMNFNVAEAEVLALVGHQGDELDRARS